MSREYGGVFKLWFIGWEWEYEWVPGAESTQYTLWIGARYTWDGSECTYKSNINSGGNDVRERIYTKWSHCCSTWKHKSNSQGVGE
jgi:hypothetical protein